MKHLLFLFISGICILSVNNNVNFSENLAGSPGNTLEITFQDKPVFGRISTVEFKNQDYCRAELKDFEFEAHFSVVSATVYFSGANFKSVKKGAITSNSLKPIKSLMKECIPGSIVVFDNVKVKGPDDIIRTIPGVSLTLY